LIFDGLKFRIESNENATKHKGSINEDIPVRKQTIPSRKSQCLPKRNASFTASHL